jgi:outer membrane protein assembly factor BamA
MVPSAIPAVRHMRVCACALRIEVLIAALACFALCAPTSLRVAYAAIDSDITLENYVSDGLPAHASLSQPAGEEGQKGEGEEGQEGEGGREKGTRLPFAILPQLGYGPESGAKAGVKFEGRDLFGGNTFSDVNVIYAQQGQAKATFTVGNNRLLDDFIFYASANYYRDPAKEYFGIGNNDAGPEEIANYDIKRARIGFTVGYRVLRRLALTLSAMYRESDVDPGKSSDSPRLPRFAPTLPGVHGGSSNYVGAAVVYNALDEVVRPTRGWKVIAKYMSANSAIFNNNTDFSKFILDASYTVPLVWRRQVLAVHGNSEVMFGNQRDIPFFELSSLGGDDTMRGYFPDRFLGKGRMVFNAEYRLKLVDFEFRKMWNVNIDGVAFGDAGRVYKGADDFLHHFGDRLRYSYGGGTRIGFSSGLVARIDVGFSEEEKGLVYLTFGHTF